VQIAVSGGAGTSAGMGMTLCGRGVKGESDTVVSRCRRWFWGSGDRFCGSEVFTSMRDLGRGALKLAAWEPLGAAISVLDGLWAVAIWCF
jgi:hypothetical protein